MSTVGFFTPYRANFQSIRETVQNFVQKYFDLASRLMLATALKIASCASLLISAALLAIKAYPRRAVHAKAIDNPIPAGLTSFCKKHPEFSELLQKAQNVVTIENFNPEQDTAITTRVVHVGKDVNKNNQVFIKAPGGKHIFARQKRAKNEQLAFLISHRLGLDVVPPTMALEGYKNEIESIFPRSLLNRLKAGSDPTTCTNSYDGVIVQEAILLDNDFNPNLLTPEQVQKAIIFNLITGRWDAQRRNTGIAKPNKIMELDNEKLGLLLSDSWLASEFSTMVFSLPVITTLLLQPRDAVIKIFIEMEDFSFDEETNQMVIRKNFDLIREFFTMYDGVRQLTVNDLMNFLKKPDRFYRPYK